MVGVSEFTFQQEMIQQLQANGWMLGKPEGYNQEKSFYNG